MLRILARALLTLTGIAIVAVALGWLFLVLPVFAPQRIAIAEKALSDGAGTPVTVAGDVRVKLGKVVRLTVQDVSVANPHDSSIDFISAKAVILDMGLSGLLTRQVALDDVDLEGAVLNMITYRDGTKSWPEANPAAREQVPDEPQVPDSVDPDDDLPGLFSSAELDIRKSSILIQNEKTGFEFLLEADSLIMRRPSDNETWIDIQGAVNGKTFTVNGNYATDAPFSMTSKIGKVSIEFEGEPVADKDGVDRIAKLTSDIEEVGDLLEALGLERSTEGVGSLEVTFGRGDQNIAIEDFEVVIDEDNGRQLKATGSVSELNRLRGIETTIGYRLFPEGQDPPNATSLEDIKITDITLDLNGPITDLDVQSLRIQTNAFGQGFDEIGQVSISKLRRTPEGKLAINDIRVHAGPRDAPYLQATGSVGDALQVEDININGTLSLPAQKLFGALGEDTTRAFGTIDGEFAIENGRTKHSNSRFVAKTKETDVWQVSTDTTLTVLDDARAFALDLEIGVDDPAKFLTAANLDPIDSGPMDLELKMLGDKKSFDNELAFSVGTTVASLNLNFKLTETGPFVRGALSSDRIKVADIRDALDFAIRVGKRMTTGANASENVQPLVLPDDREVQPLVLEDERKVQPLVLENQNGNSRSAPRDEDIKTAARAALNVDTIAQRADVDLAIDIKSVEGARGISNIKSAFVVRDGRLALGPLNLALDDGYFNFGAEMDVVQRPGILTVNGSTGGWDLGKITSSIGASIGLEGIMSGRFALSGSNASIDRFVKTMAGNAEVFMGRGRIDTSLLKLAGFGVIPWLFSRDLRAGYADIVCIAAPLRIDRGKVTTNGFVLETKDVQVVARGSVDVLKDTVSIRAEPRPVGRPLARSAVPVDISGNLSDPKVSPRLRGARPTSSGAPVSMPADRKPCKPDIDQLQ